MTRLLALSWCMPPIEMPRSIQVSRLLAALADLGWETDVVCVDPDSLRQGTILDKELERPAGGKVRKYRVPSLEDWIPVRGLIRLIPSLGQLPDPKWVWKNAAFRQCRLLAEKNNYDAFISFAQPWTDHLAGLKFKQQSRLPWVAHFSDPWTDNPYVQASPWVKQRLYEMEQAVISTADAVVFVSSQTTDLVMEKYPEEWQTRTHVIPHGFESLSPAIKQTRPASNSRVEFLYTGNFYGLRTPENLLRAANKLNQKPGYKNSFGLRFAGHNMERFKQTAHDLGLDNLTVFEGPVTFARSQELAVQADALLVIDAPSVTPSVFLPSKLVDYLAFEKPILGITPLIGSSADLIRKLDCPVVDPNDIEGISANLARMIDNKKTGTDLLPPTFKQEAEQYNISYAAKQMDELLRTLIKE